MKKFIIVFLILFCVEGLQAQTGPPGFIGKKQMVTLNTMTSIRTNIPKKKDRTNSTLFQFDPAIGAEYSFVISRMNVVSGKVHYGAGRTPEVVSSRDSFYIDPVIGNVYITPIYDYSYLDLGVGYKRFHYIKRGFVAPVGGYTIWDVTFTRILGIKEGSATYQYEENSVVLDVSTVGLDHVKPNQSVMDKFGELSALSFGLGIGKTFVIDEKWFIDMNVKLNLMTGADIRWLDRGYRFVDDYIKKDLRNAHLLTIQAAIGSIF